MKSQTHTKKMNDEITILYLIVATKMYFISLVFGMRTYQALTFFQEKEIILLALIFTENHCFFIHICTSLSIHLNGMFKVNVICNIIKCALLR